MNFQQQFMNVNMLSESQQIVLFQPNNGHISEEISHLWFILNLNWLFN